MICGLTADERDALREGLGRLPDTMPPRIVWDRIREQAEAEGLIRSTASRNGRRPGISVAASRPPSWSR